MSETIQPHCELKQNILFLVQNFWIPDIKQIKTYLGEVLVSTVGSTLAWLFWGMVSHPVKEFQFIDL